jgi:hypothetical protein
MASSLSTRSETKPMACGAVVVHVEFWRFAFYWQTAWHKLHGCTVADSGKRVVRHRNACNGAAVFSVWACGFNSESI